MESLQLTGRSVDLCSGRVEPGGESLTPRELDLLRYLAARPRQVVSRAELLQQAFGYAASAQSRAVDKAMVTLRKKVELDPAQPEHLLTAERAGYRFQPATESGELVGRTAELAALAQRLARPGLVTLHGPGGVGKTALARRASRAWTRTAGAPALLCRVGEGSLRIELLQALAAGLEVELPPQGSADEGVARALAARGEVLLVLDGFETALAHSDLVQALVLRAPRARLLVTSRVALGLPGEAVVAVPPLSLPEAVELLAARAAERGQPVGADGLAALAERLDCLPLALELAVPWLAVTGAEGLAERLTHPLELPGPAQDGLRRMLARSWQQLDDAERLALAELSVFGGGFLVERAEAVLSSAPDGRAPLVLLESLLRASLLRRAAEGGRVRLSLLDTVRAYAAEQLAARGREITARARRAHAAALLAAHAGHPEPDLTGDTDELAEAARQMLLLGEHARATDCLALLDRAISGGPSLLLLRSLSAALLSDPALPPELRGQAMILHGRALKSTGDTSEADRLLREALPLVQRDSRLTAATLLLLGWLHVMCGETGQAATTFAAARAWAADADQRGAVALGEARVAKVLGDFSQAAVLIREALTHYQRGQMPLKAAGARYDLGLLLTSLGDGDGARSALAAALATCRQAGSARNAAKIEQILAALANLDEDMQAYLRSCRRVAELHGRAGAVSEQARWLGNVGRALLQDGQREEARDVLQTALQLAEEAQLYSLVASLSAHTGHLLASEGDLEGAEAELARSCALCEGSGEQLRLIDALCALALVRHRLGRTADGERALARAAALGEALGLRPDSDGAQSIEQTILALGAMR